MSIPVRVSILVQRRIRGAYTFRYRRLGRLDVLDCAGEYNQYEGYSPLVVNFTPASWSWHERARMLMIW